MIKAFFNRPGEPAPIDDLVQDIESATQRIVLASAWFTDHTIARAISECRATTKIALLNKADIPRGDDNARKILTRNPGINVCILGTESFEDGVMHHKFLVIDRSIVWTGSFNFTYHAHRNYETLLRIDDPNINEQFWQETVQLVYGDIITLPDRITVPDEVIPCHECGQEVDAVDVQWFYGNPLCRECAQDYYERY